jgi:hypothetical protein
LEGRAQKAQPATKGAPGAPAQSKLLSELAEWTLEYKRAVVLRVCNLSAWAKTDEVPWSLTRELGQRYK